MLGWIAGFVARWEPVVSRGVRDLVHWGLHALASVVYTVFGNVGKAWVAVVHSLDWMLIHVPRFVAAVFTHIDTIITKDIPAIWHWITAQVAAIGRLIAHVYDLAVSYALSLYNKAVRLLDDLSTWVLTHVLVPLTNITTSLRNDLLKWGYFAYQLLNDPGKLAGILAKYIVAAVLAIFWTVADVIGRFIAGIILHQARRLISVIETVLTAVL